MIMCIGFVLILSLFERIEEISHLLGFSWQSKIYF